MEVISQMRILPSLFEILIICTLWFTLIQNLINSKQWLTGDDKESTVHLQVILTLFVSLYFYLYIYWYNLFYTHTSKIIHCKNSMCVSYILDYDSKLTLNPHDLITVQLSQQMWCTLVCWRTDWTVLILRLVLHLLVLGSRKDFRSMTGGSWWSLSSTEQITSCREVWSKEENINQMLVLIKWHQ